MASTTDTEPRQSIGFIFGLCAVFLVLYFSPLFAVLYAMTESRLLEDPIHWLPNLADALAGRKIDVGTFSQLLVGLSSAGGFAYLRRKRRFGRARVYSQIILAILAGGSIVFVVCYFIFVTRKTVLQQDYAGPVFEHLVDWCSTSVTNSVALTATLLGIRLQETADDNE